MIKPKSILRGVVGCDTLKFDIRVDNTGFTPPVKVGIRGIPRRYCVRVAPRRLRLAAGRSAGKVVITTAVGGVDAGRERGPAPTIVYGSHFSTTAAGFILTTFIVGTTR